MRFRFHVLRVIAAMGCVGTALAQPARPSSLFEKLHAPRQPNIIFILADDLGYGDLGCYGQKKIKTPHLDRLAAQGMRFTQCYAGSTVCAPSRASLMLGQHMGHIRIRGNEQHPLRPDDVTVAKVLKAAGYNTGIVGKWGLGREGSTGVPTKQGFDEWFGYLEQVHAHNYYPTQLYRNDRVYTVQENLDGKKGMYVHDLFTKVATNFLRVNKYGPFFLYLAYTLPHANNELGAATGNGMEIPSDTPYSNEPWPQPEKNKAAMITRLDADVGMIMKRLRDLNMEENTVLMFSSDNGPHKEGGVKAEFLTSSGPLRGTKRDLYEGGIRVPLIVRWPAKIKPGSVSDHLCAFWDFLPTAAEIAGTNAPPGTDGVSFLPTLLGQPQTNQHPYLYWEFHEGGSKQAVRIGDWKAVKLAPGLLLELYDLRTDLGETRNVAMDHPEQVAKMEETLKLARTESDLYPLEAPKAK